MDWTVKELAGTNLGDARLDERLMTMVADLSERPASTVPLFSGNWAKTKAAYRFWDNSKVTPRGILQSHIERTVRRAFEHDVVLVAQDTTEIDLTSHRKTAGVGYLASSKCRGFLVHSLLAISPTGVPLGLVGQQHWTRPFEELGKTAQRHRKSIDEKESGRWLEGLATAERTLAGHPQVVVVADREADIFELFAAPRRANVSLLVRVRHARRAVEHEAKQLQPALEQAPSAGQVSVTVPRRDDCPTRQAVLTVRFAKLVIRPPKQLAGQTPQTMFFILAEEECPPEGVQPIRWILASTMPVESLDDAVRMIGWYVFRWRIERFHYVLKSGCGIEKLELETVERMRRALATYSIVAWRLLWLTYAARETPDVSCEIVLPPREWKLLYGLTHRGQCVPEEPPTLREAVHWIARLGGFLGRRHDGEPGVKTLWRGMKRFHDVLEAIPSLRELLAEQHATYG